MNGSRRVTCLAYGVARNASTRVRQRDPQATIIMTKHTLTSVNAEQYLTRRRVFGNSAALAEAADLAAVHVITAAAAASCSSSTTGMTQRAG